MSYHDDNYTFDQFEREQNTKPIIFTAKRCEYDEKKDCALIDACMCLKPIPNQSGEYCQRCTKILTP